MEGTSINKRIGIDGRLIGTKYGGIGRYTFELVKHLLEVDKSNDYFLFYNQKDSSLKEVLELKTQSNINLVECNSRHYSLSEQTKFLWKLNKYNLDLVHFPNFNVPLFYKKPFVVTIHDMVHHKIGGAKKSHLVHFEAYKKVIQSAAKKARAIITVSEAAKKDIVNYLQVLPRKIEVVYEGTSLDTEVSESKLKEVKDKYLLAKPYFLFVGVLERKKNIINLTRGFDEFLKKYKLDIDLVIVGGVDRHYPDIRHKALDIKNKDHVVFTGFVEDQDLAALYKGAFSFVTASLHEGFGLPGVEAMKYGLPILSSNIEVFNEVYENAAMYFDALNVSDIAEKMNLLVRDPQFHKQMQEKSFKRSLEFSWEKAAQDTLKIYNEVLVKSV